MSNFIKIYDLFENIDKYFVECYYLSIDSSQEILKAIEFIILLFTFNVFML